MFVPHVCVLRFILEKRKPRQEVVDHTNADSDSDSDTSSSSDEGRGLEMKITHLSPHFKNEMLKLK